MAASIVVLWLVVVGYHLVAGGLAARSGAAALERQPGSTGDLSSMVGLLDSAGAADSAGQSLLDAADDLRRASGHLHSPVLAPLAFVPVVGTQLRSAQDMSDAGETVASRAGHATAELEGLLDESNVTGDSALASIREVEAILDELGRDIADIDLGPADGLLPPLKRARNRFAAEHEDVIGTLASSRQAAHGVGRFMEGPSHYLLMAANNAEMRAGSGMFLQAGAMDVTDGEFTVGELTATGLLALNAPAAPIDPDIQDVWGTLQPAVDWRNINLTPRFDESAIIASDLWAASGGGPVDGVIAVDVIGVSRLLELTGPVTLDSGETVSSETVQQDLLLEQYQLFGDDRTARRDRLGDVARAAFDALNDRSVPGSELLRVFRELGAGRHLLMWSPDRDQNLAWEALGTDGVPPPDSLMLSVLNRGGNKLDPYLRVCSAVEISDSGPYRRVGIEVSLTNIAPVALPPYVAGPFPGTGLDAGEYKGIVSLTLPASAGNTTISGGVPAVLGDDGPVRVAGTEVRLERGGSAVVRFDFEVPLAQSSVEVLPGARIPATQWSVGSESFTDEVSHRLDLLEPADQGAPTGECA